MGLEPAGDAPPSPPSPWTWTAPQRRVLILVVSALWLTLVFRYACNRNYVSDPQPARPHRFDELADRIDPNTADWQTLAVLPAIGEKRAKDIVAYREEVQASYPGKPVFARPADLLRVKGVGTAIVAAIEPYLLFPTATTTTLPATAPGL